MTTAQPRPSGWIRNPQAMAAVSKRKEYEGHPDLGTPADPDTWLTPRYVLEQLGAFDLDPCAAEENPAWVAPRCYTKRDDGLTAEWSGRVFMNPPFSNTIPWIRKHAEHGRGISLVPTSIESRIWRELVWSKAPAVLMLHGRVRFCNPDGSNTGGRPLRPVALIAWSQDDAAVLAGSQLAGVLLTKWEQR